MELGDGDTAGGDDSAAVGVDVDVAEVDRAGDTVPAADADGDVEVGVGDADPAGAVVVAIEDTVDGAGDGVPGWLAAEDDAVAEATVV